MTGRRAVGQTEREIEVRIDPGASTRCASPMLFGLFLEDINHGGDGGLNANVVANHSFDAVYVDRHRYSEVIALTTRKRAKRRPDRTRHWHVSGGSLAARNDGAVSDGAWYGRIELTSSRAQVENWGHRAVQPSIPVTAGAPWTFDALVRSEGFSGSVEVALVSLDGSPVAAAPLTVTHGGWGRVGVRLEPHRTTDVALRLVLDGSGHVDLDEVRLVPDDHWGVGDPRWSQGLLRRDLVEALRDLRPSFLRFPGGCIVEGLTLDNAYDWKRSVGPLEYRRGDYNLWGIRVPDGDYAQSNQIGFYEYFLLCEDLGMAPMPVISAGLSCQPRSNNCVEIHSPEFKRYIADAIDLVDWATADPATNRWAALRAEAGHPEPFELRHLAIGNENYGEHYFEAFAAIRAAVDAHRPGMEFVLSASPFIGKRLREAWEFARTQPAGLVVDEHYYRSPKWFTESTRRYDDYDRNGPKAFVGEYAAAPPTVTMKIPGPTPNTFASALAEAAFLTGIERNADVVAMTCYAPLLNFVGRGQWRHNLIDFNRREVCRSTNYYVQQLFGESLGDRIVSVDGTLPDDVYASALATDERVSIKLVSMADGPTRVTLTVTGALEGSARVTTLSGSPNDRNTLPPDGPPTLAVTPSESTTEVKPGAIELTIGPHSVVRIEAPLRSASG